MAQNDHAYELQLFENIRKLYKDSNIRPANLAEVHEGYADIFEDLASHLTELPKLLRAEAEKLRQGH